MAHCTPVLLIDDLGFPEGPRWHDGRLFFSDMVIREVMAVDLQGLRETIASLPDIPSGLGWLPDGDLLVVSEIQRQVLRLTPGGLTVHADTAPASPDIINDMVVDLEGRAYVGGWGSGVDESNPPGGANLPNTSSLLLVARDGRVRVAADGMISPNGLAITPDGTALIVAETFANRLTAFDIAADGSLSNRRVFADLGVPPDGICLDEEGCVWVAIPCFEYGGPGGFLRVADGGEVRDRIDGDGFGAYACALGGPARQHLFLLESAVLGLPRGRGDGRIRVLTVDVPGAELP